MNPFSSQKERYITLKEASEISGYSSDYIGQLIRGGKIGGKQVYMNPVWLTTERDVREYMQEKRSKEERGRWSARLRSLKTRLRSEFELVKLYKGVLYATIGVSMIFSLFLFYMFSVSLDAWIAERSSGGSDTETSSSL